MSEPDYDLIFSYEVVTANPRCCIEILDSTPETPRDVSSANRFMIVRTVSNEGESNDGEILDTEYADSFAKAMSVVARYTEQIGLWF
jgi:hypothetical protein